MIWIAPSQMDAAVGKMSRSELTRHSASVSDKIATQQHSILWFAITRQTKKRFGRTCGRLLWF